MRIVSIEITNFRSIKNAKVTAAPYTVFLGANNTGKSNFLHALNFALNPSEKLCQEDFPLGVFPVNPTIIDLEFRELTDAEMTKYSGHVRRDGTFVLRRRALLTNDHPLNNGYRSLSRSGLERRIPQAKLKPGFLPDMFFLPALFDLERELKLDRTSRLGRMIHNAAPLIADQQNIPVANPIDAGGPWGFAALLQTLNAGLTAFGATVDISRPPLSAMRLLEVDGAVEITDGIKTTASRKGHGLQRALVFAIVREWVRRRATGQHPPIPLEPAAAETVIFAMEEPELNIHPQAVRQLIEELMKLAKEPNRQVLLCSHSPHFVDIASVESIKLVSKDAEHSTTVRECVGRLFPSKGRKHAVRQFNATAYFNSDRSEMFFADKIVLVEGATEKKVLPFLANLLGVFRSGVSIIDCDGKYNLRLFMAVLDRFQLPYTVVHDLDPVPENPSRQQRTVFAENVHIATAAAVRGNTVVVLNRDFEQWAGLNRRRNKPFSAYEAFAKRPKEAIGPEITNTVTAIYAK